MREEVAFTADTALRLSRFIGTSAEMWLNMQRKYDLEKIAIELGDKLKKIEPIKA